MEVAKIEIKKPQALSRPTIQFLIWYPAFDEDMQARLLAFHLTFWTFDVTENCGVENDDPDYTEIFTLSDHSLPTVK